MIAQGNMIVLCFFSHIIMSSFFIIFIVLDCCNFIKDVCPLYVLSIFCTFVCDVAIKL